MPEPFFALLCELKTYGSNPGNKISKFGNYKYVEDANYGAGKLFEYHLNKALVDGHAIWEKIADCGGTPFVHIISYDVNDVGIHLTIWVQEEELHDDVDSTSRRPPLGTGSSLENIVTDPYRYGTQGPGSQPALSSSPSLGSNTMAPSGSGRGSFNHHPAAKNPPSPTVIPLYPQTPNIAAWNRNRNTLDRSGTDWLLCQPFFGTDTTSQLPRGGLSSPERSEILDAAMTDRESSTSDPSDSLSSTFDTMLPEQSYLRPDSNTSTSVKEPNPYINDICFTCLAYALFLFLRLPPPVKHPHTLPDSTTQRQPTTTPAALPASDSLSLPLPSPLPRRQQRPISTLLPQHVLISNHSRK